MNAPPHARAFSQLESRKAANDPHRLSSDRERILWVLSVAKDDSELSYLTPAQVADILTDVEGIHVSRQRVAAVLESEKGSTVARKRIQQRLRYKIMKAGEDEIGAASQAGATFVDPERALTEIRRIESLLATLKGDLRICDPYVENRTLDYLACCSAADELRLLTSNVLKESTFRRDLAAYRTEHSVPLNVRVAAPGKLHDRYIIHKDGMLFLGTSLNGFAKKQSFVIALGHDLRDATTFAFDKFWNSSSAFK